MNKQTQKIGLTVVNSRKLNKIMKRNDEIELAYEQNQKYKMLQKICDLAEQWDAKINGDR